MSTPGRGIQLERGDNTAKPVTYMRDSENTMLMSPLDMQGNKFKGSYNKFFSLKRMLLQEDKEKYLLQYQARF